ncbi:MAG: isochorismatase family protein [Sinobacteraceae bacterium]|nr:isochorismatase family protein [Planctomycetota bacterium]MCP5328247.1 isochorismatase family protein [Nevskiaceae bacterium]MCP5360213.1 isochorismatase family protein [Nevskiaceae bacterium]MCP5466650.1 isochorismatase family protein [Nevskiaceae bacterium]
MVRPWDPIVSAEEIARYKAAGFGRPTGMGKHPALLIIDVQYRTVGLERRPYWQAIEEFKTSCGEAGWAAIDHIVPLLALCRERGYPVFYPYVAPKMGYDAGRLAQKVPEIMNISARGYDFPTEIAPRDGDVLVPKKHPSAFFGTPLVSYLIDKGVDTLIVTGCSTSGCVRGTVVDGFAYNFRVTVPEECVFDRSEVSHAVNLFDMAYKYGDVLPVREVMAALP